MIRSVLLCFVDLCVCCIASFALFQAVNNKSDIIFPIFLGYLAITSFVKNFP